MAPELERVNELGYRLPLNATEIKRMQSLNRGWASSSTQTTERFRYTRTHTRTHTHTQPKRVGLVPFALESTVAVMLSYPKDQAD